MNVLQHPICPDAYLKKPYGVQVLHVVDENKLNIKKHVHQYRFSIDGCKMQSDLSRC